MPRRGNPKEKDRGSASKHPWNRGKKNGKTGQQHLFIPRDQLELFFAVGLYWAGPVYAAAIWMCLVTSRRISETLLLRGTDIRVDGGEDHDAPHVLYQKRDDDKQYRGAGKLGAEKVVSRLSEDSVDGIKFLVEHGLQHECRILLEQYRGSHPDLFLTKTLRRDDFRLDVHSNDFIFPSRSKKKGCRPNMSRQTAWKGLDRMREVMFKLTGARRWNPTKKFRGQRVTLHGATRHTSASLLLFNKECPQAAPSEHVVMEIQQRSDARVFRKHYCHAEEQQVKAALKYGSPPSVWGIPKTPTSSASGGLPQSRPVDVDEVVPANPEGGGEVAATPQQECAKTHQYPSRNARRSKVESGGLKIPAEAFRKAKKREAKRARAAELVEMSR